MTHNALSEALAMGKHYTWGPIVALHQIGDIAILEHQKRVYRDNVGTSEYDGTEFHLYVKNEDTSHGATTLDSAIAQALSYKYEGPNGRAGHYFMKMLQQGLTTEGLKV